MLTITFSLLHIYPLGIIFWMNKINFTFHISLKEPVNDGMKGRLSDSHLNVSAWRTWQLAWCSNWSSSHKKFWQKEQRKIRPPVQTVKTSSSVIFLFFMRECEQVNLNQMGVLPWSQTPRSHSMQSASVRGHAQAWVLRHFLPWHTQASQKSHTAPFYYHKKKKELLLTVSCATVYALY